MRPTVSFAACTALFISAFLLSGCGGGGGETSKKKTNKNLPAPTWQNIDNAKLPPIEGEDYSKDVDPGSAGDPRIRVFDPKGWNLAPNRGTKGAKGKFVIGFQKGSVNLNLWGRDSASETWTEETLPDLAKAIQEKYETAVKMIKLGNTYGVTFPQRVPHPKRPGYFFDKQIVVAAMAGRLYMYEAIAEQGKLTNAVKDALFTIVAHTKVLAEGAADEVASSPATPDEPKTETVATTTPEPATPASPEPVASTTTTTAATPSEPAPATTVAVTETPKESPAPKPAAEPAKKPAPPKKKAATKDILNELDDLLNN